MKLTDLTEILQNGDEFGNPSWTVEAKTDDGRTVRITRFPSFTKPHLTMMQREADQWPHLFETVP